jgi:glycosyltransferase involved in cell wall biosynthesis
VADVLRSIDQNLKLDIYGNATAENRSLFEAHPSINYHGFVDAAALREVIEDADVLIHAESFDSKIIPKLRYAFSTKIAQCLCAGRCFISFAPAQTASSQYLAQLDGPVLVSDEQSLRKVLTDVIHEPALRQQLARKSGLVGEMNHQMKRTSQRIREEILKSIL